jgi:hypothetical protein
MGNQLTCPADFDQGIGLSCHIRCPADFKYSQQRSPPGESCVFMMDNDFSIRLKQLPPIPNSPEFELERKRFADEYANIKNNLPLVEKAVVLKKEEGERVAKHDAIKDEYAVFTSVKDELKKTTDAIKPIRAKTSPQSDIEKERKEILSVMAVKLHVVQSALLTILFCMLVYVVLPVEYAHNVAFLVACSGIAVGIYLSTI